MRKIEKETLFGGIFGGIAIVAIIANVNIILTNFFIYFHLSLFLDYI